MKSQNDIDWQTDLNDAKEPGLGQEQEQTLFGKKLEQQILLN